MTQIRQIHEESRGTYSSPRVHAELTLGLGLPVNLKRIARLMREAGIQGLYRRRRHGCTVRGPAAQPSADLVNRQFTVDAPNRLWITDITEHPTAEGKVYCAAVMDAHFRLVVGWSIAEHMRTEVDTDDGVDEFCEHGHRPDSFRGSGSNGPPSITGVGSPRRRLNSRPTRSGLLTARRFAASPVTSEPSSRA